jgi:hypothetical protein
MHKALSVVNDTLIHIISTFARAWVCVVITNTINISVEHREHYRNNDTKLGH